MKTYVLDARTAQPHFPGIGRYVKNLAAHLPPLLAADERLVLLTGAEWQPADLPQQVATVPVAASPFSLRQQRDVPRLLKRLNATVYHSPYYVMPLRPGVPTVVTLHDLIPLLFPNLVSRRARLLFRLLATLALRVADVVIADSHASAADIEREFGRKATPIWLATDKRFCPTDAGHVRQKFDLPPDYILYFGSNKPHKNLSRLLEAWALCQPTPDKPLVIGGAWYPEFPTAKTIAATLPEGSVRFLGRIDDADLPALYSGATLFAFVSQYEGFGLPVLEALACGVPVLTSNVSSLPEVAGDAALWADPHNVPQIATLLGKLLHDGDLRADLKARARTQAAHFSWRQTAQQTLDCYRSLANA